MMRQALVGSHSQFASSHETASGVSTTMSWSVSTNDHGLMAVPVAGTTSTEVVGLDMIPHKNKLVALAIQEKAMSYQHQPMEAHGKEYHQARKK